MDGVIFLQCLTGQVPRHFCLCSQQGRTAAFSRRNITVSHMLNSWDLLLLAFDLTAKSTGKIGTIFWSVFVFWLPFSKIRLFTLLSDYAKDDQNNIGKKAFRTSCYVKIFVKCDIIKLLGFGAKYVFKHTSQMSCWEDMFCRRKESLIHCIGPSSTKRTSKKKKAKLTKRNPFIAEEPEWFIPTENMA